MKKLLQKLGYKLLLPLSVFLLAAILFLIYSNIRFFPFISDILFQQTGECRPMSSPEPWETVPKCIQVTYYDNFRYIIFNIIFGFLFFVSHLVSSFWAVMVASFLFYFFLGWLIDKIIDYYRQ